jgi:hypothetical protein
MNSFGLNVFSTTPARVLSLSLSFNSRDQAAMRLKRSAVTMLSSTDRSRCAHGPARPFHRGATLSGELHDEMSGKKHCKRPLCPNELDLGEARRRTVAGRPAAKSGLRCETSLAEWLTGADQYRIEPKRI